MLRISVLVVFLCFVPAAQAYSVLTHEAIIDAAWDQNIQPLLVKRFPMSAPGDLIMAHGYAYAGAIIQDMGYYPFGSKFFSDLTHYVRSGDFVVTLIRESEDLDEYAFALGALAHYAADTEGHSIAVNPAVAIQYPKLKREFGRIVTYEDNPVAHLKVEFGFDVLQVARGNYAPQSYHDFIGFHVSKPLLERAFHDTYGLDLMEVFGDLDLALGTYRRTVSKIIPEMTRVAWRLEKDKLVSGRPGLTRRRFQYNLSRASYRKEWDDTYKEPGLGARILAFIIRILPKFGPLKTVDVKPPTMQTATLFEESFNRTMTLYRSLLAQAGEQRLALENRDFDTGEPTRPARYRLADEAYAKLTIKLADKDPSQVDPVIRDNILGYFRDLNLDFAARNNPKEWTQTVTALDKLRTAPAKPRNPATPATSLTPQ
jgi:Zinc dependent phospholipase C